MAYIIKPTTELIGTAFLENALEEGVVLTKTHGMSLLSYDYKFVYSRDNTGTPYGAPTCIEAKFVVEVANLRECRVLYNRMNNNVPEAISFLFNTKFDQDTDNLISFESGLTARCYIVDLEEFYDVDAVKRSDSSQSEQMRLCVKVLITKVTYIGENDMRVVLHISE